ncbi:MAG: diguanylate cyclase (GGDEF)-like protein/PAS domain S-box-containing protein [Paracoccaceae bacterium]|jgi:diguanylate cyclase (GGDEF)-like protein/PAS domain S-box-containing protein
MERQGLVTAIQAASSGIVIADFQLPDRPLVFVNPAFEKMTGYAEAVGRNCRFLQGEDTDSATVKELRVALEEGRHITCRILNYRKDGSTFWNDLTMSPIYGEDRKVTGFVGIQKDATEEVILKQELAKEVLALRETRRALKVANTELRRVAYTDAVTGIPTRMLFFDRVKQALARGKRSGDVFAIIFMDLDGFKQVNDSFGHEAGDIVLRSVAERLQGQIRETDTLARFGGDEFVLLVDSSVTRGVVADICDRISRTFSAPFELGDAEIRLGISFGAAFNPFDGDDVEDLIRFADTAMYETKNSKRRSSTNVRVIQSA